MIGYRRLLKLGHAFGVEGRMRPPAEPSSEPFIDPAALAATTDAATPVAPVTRAASRRAVAIWVAVLGGLAIFAIAALFAYRFWQRPAVPPVEPTVSRAAPQAPAPTAEPVIRNPVAADAGRAALPPLAESDGVVGAALADLFSRDAFGRLFYPDGIVHRFVATIDNLPRQTVALRIMPVHPAAGSFLVASHGGRLVAADNGARYAPYVQLLDAVDTQKLVAVYRQLYPLFQQAYVELGYPNGYFNDRLVEVIDDLLATPEPRGTVALIQPKVTYQFADPDLEALPAGQKLLLRIGPANAAKVKAKLTEIRRQIARERPPAS